MVLILTAINGPQKGLVFEFPPRGEPVVIGRHHGGLKLTDSKASRHHADLWFEGGQWQVRDCESRNGTRVNRERIAAATVIKSGDWLQIGRSVFAIGIVERDLAITAVAEHVSASGSGSHGSGAAQAQLLADDDAAADNNSASLIVAAIPDGDEADSVDIAARPRTAAASASDPTLNQALADVDDRLESLAATTDRVLEHLRQVMAGQERAATAITADQGTAASRDGQSESLAQAAAQQQATLRQLAEQIESRWAQHDRTIAALMDAARGGEHVATLRATVQSLGAQLEVGEQRHEAQTRELLEAVRQAAEATPQRLTPALEAVSAQLRSQAAHLAQVDEALSSARQADGQADERHWQALDQLATRIESITTKQEDWATTLKLALVAEPEWAADLLRRVAQFPDRQAAEADRAIAALTQALAGEAGHTRQAVQRSGEQVEQALAARLDESVRRIEASTQAGADQTARRIESAITAGQGETIAASAQQAQQVQARIAAASDRVSAEVAGVTAELSRAAQGLAAGQVEQQLALGARIDAGARAVIERQDRLESALTQAMGLQGERTSAAVQELARKIEEQTQRHERVALALHESLSARPGWAGELAQRWALEAQAQSARQDELVKELRSALAAEPQQLEALLRTVAQRMDKQEATQMELQQQTLTAIKAAFDQQALNEVIRQAVAAQATRQESLLGQIAESLQAQASRQQELLDGLRQVAQSPALAADAGQDEEMRRMIAQLETQAAAQAELAAQVRAVAQTAGAGAAAAQEAVRVVAAQGEAHRAQLELLRADAAAGRQADEPVRRQIAEHLAALRGREDHLAQSLREVMTAATAEERAALQAVTQRLEARHERGDEMIEAVSAAMETAPTQIKLLVRQMLAEEAATRPAQATVAAFAHDGVAGRIGAATTDAAQDPGPLLNELKDRADADAWREGLVASVAPVRSRRREAMVAAAVVGAGGVLLGAIWLQRGGPAASPMMAASISGEPSTSVVAQGPAAPAVSQQDIADTVKEALASDRAQTETLIKELLDRVGRQGVIDQEQLAALIRQSSVGAPRDDKAIQSLIDEVRTLREQQALALKPPVGAAIGPVDARTAAALSGANAGTSIALAPGAGSAAMGANANVPQFVTPILILPGNFTQGTPLVVSQPGDNSTALAHLDTGAATTVAARPEAPKAAPLTKLQELYRSAFETGLRLRLGGAVDPLTGKPIAGRVLDPAAAREAGCKTWEEWYHLDDRIEQMKLRQQASEFNERSNRGSVPVMVDGSGNIATQSQISEMRRILEEYRANPVPLGLAPGDSSMGGQQNSAQRASTPTRTAVP